MSKWPLPLRCGHAQVRMLRLWLSRHCSELWTQHFGPSSHSTVCDKSVQLVACLLFCGYSCCRHPSLCLPDDFDPVDPPITTLVRKAATMSYRARDPQIPSVWPIWLRCPTRGNSHWTGCERLDLSSHLQHASACGSASIADRGGARLSTGTPNIPPLSTGNNPPH